MQSSALLKTGVSTYWRTNVNNDGSTRNRWGDYSATMVDPVNDTDLWTIQEYAEQYAGTLTNRSGRWGTWWGQLALPVPANDQFAIYFAITNAEGTTNGTTIRGARETGEPNHGNNANSPSVWYRWIAPTSGEVCFDPLPIASSSSIAVAVYTGSAVNSLTLVKRAVGTAPMATFDAVAGTTYQIAVAGANNARVDFTLHWIQPTAPMFVLVPQIQPESTNVIVGETVSFTTLAIGAPSPTYIWRLEGTDITGATNGSIYTITNVQQSHATNYTVIATNSSGSVASTVARLYVHPDSTARLSSTEVFETNKFRFLIAGVSNRPYAVLVSTNLSSPTNWYRIHTNFVSFWYTNLSLSNDPMRFYQAITN